MIMLFIQEVKRSFTGELSRTKTGPDRTVQQEQEQEVVGQDLIIGIGSVLVTPRTTF